MFQGFWTNEILQELLTRENAVLENALEGSHPVVMCGTTSTAFKYLIDAFESYEASGILQPVEIEIGWMNSLIANFDDVEDEETLRQNEYRINRILHEVSSIISSYQSLTPKEMKKLLPHMPNIRLTNTQRSYFFVASSSVAVKSLIDRIQNPGNFACCPPGEIMKILPGNYICNLILRYRCVDIKVKLFRKELV